MTLEELKVVLTLEAQKYKANLKKAENNTKQSVQQINASLNDIGKHEIKDINDSIKVDESKIKKKGTKAATALASGLTQGITSGTVSSGFITASLSEQLKNASKDLDTSKNKIESIYGTLSAVNAEWEKACEQVAILEDKIINASTEVLYTNTLTGDAVSEMSVLKERYLKTFTYAEKLGDATAKYTKELRQAVGEAGQTIDKIEQLEEQEKYQKLINAQTKAEGAAQANIERILGRKLGITRQYVTAILNLAKAKLDKEGFQSMFKAIGGTGKLAVSAILAAFQAIPVAGQIALVVVAALAIKFMILKAVIKAVVGVIKAFGKVCATAVKVVWKLSLLGPAFKLLGNAIKKVGSTIKDAITSPLKDALSDFGSTISNMISKSSGVQSALSGLKGSFLVAFQPILNLVVPALTVLINALSSVCMWVAKLGAMLSGKTLGALKADAQAAYGVAEGMDAAGAAAEDANNTMGIDELNVISQDSGGGGSSANSIIPDFSGIGGEGFTSFADSFNNLLDNLIAGLPTLSSLLLGASDSINNFFTNLYDGLTNADVTEKVKTLAAGLATSINDFIANTDWTLIGKTIGAGLNRAVDFVSTFFETFDWAGWAKSFTDSINGFIQEVDWANVGKMLFEGVHGALVFCIEFIKGIDWQAIGQALANLIKGIDWWTLIKDIFSLLWEIVKATFSLIWGLIVGLIIEPIVALFNDIKTKVTAKMAELKIKLVEIWTSIKTVVIDKVTQLKNKVNEIWTIVKTWVVEKATKIKEDVSTAFTNMKKTVIDVFDAIKNGIKTPINGIIRFINKMISGICDGVNAVVDALNTIEVSLPDWDILGEYAGASLGLNLNHVVPFQIPELAKGGIVNSGQLFMANENGPELVGRYGNQTGVMNNDQIVSAVSTGVFNAMMEAMKNGSQAVNVFLDGKQIEASVRGTAQSRGAIIANGGVLNYAY